MQDNGITVIDEQENPTSMDGIKVIDNGDISVPLAADDPESPIKVVDDESQRDDYEERRERKKNRRPLNERPNHVQVSALKNLLHSRDADLERLQAELQRKEYDLQQAQMIAAHKEQIATINNEYALNMKKQNAHQRLVEATEAQDAEKIAAAHADLVTTEVELRELERFKQSTPDIYKVQQQAQDEYYYEPEVQAQPRYQDQYAYDEQQEIEPEYDEEIKSTIDEFLIENPQFDHRKRDYDPTRYRKFMEKGKSLAKSYMQQGDDDYVNSKQFLEEVAREIEGEYRAPTRTPSKQRSSPMVAPVNRGNGSYNGGRDFVFTRKEFEPFSRLPEIMKEKDPQKLAAQYMKVREDLQNKGLLGNGMRPRHRTHVSTSI